VYVVVPAVEVFIVLGDHVPGTPLLDVVGNTGGVEFLHKEPYGVKIEVVDD
jgi:hypothetical protein